MKEQREPRCRPRKCSPSPFLAAVLLTIGAAQSAGAYEFTKPQTPTLPDNLPTQKLEVFFRIILQHHLTKLLRK